MIITRKTFLKTSSVLFSGMMFGSYKSFANILQNGDGFKTLKNNIGIFTGSGGTIGWFITDNAVVVIDSQMPDSAKNFITGYKEKSSRNIDFLINTHHHGDHTSGNIIIKDIADKIVAHENCPKLQKKAYGEGEKAKSQVYADTTFKDEWTKDFGNEKLTASYFGPAHTGGDIIIHFENSNIAHAGDIVFNNVFPVIDQKGGGSIKQWIDYLEKAEKKYDNDTIFIFGHADSNENVTGRKNDLVEMRNYLSALLEFVDKQIKSGRSLDDVKKANEIPGFANLKERRSGARASNLEAAYNELKS